MSFAAKDSIIEQELTNNQKKAAENTAQEFAQENSSGSVDELMKQIIYVLLDKKSFTQAGSDFHKKLNTIRKTLREGKWAPPGGQMQKKADELQRSTQEARLRFRELQGECRHWEHLLVTAKEKNKTVCVEQYKKHVLQCKRKLENFCQSAVKN